MARKPPSYAAVELQPVEAPDATQPVADLNRRHPRDVEGRQPPGRLRKPLRRSCFTSIRQP